jgi:hypothetical protein
MLWKGTHSAVVEAKLTCDSFAKLPRKIDLRHQKARNEAASTRGYAASEYVAITFAVPRFKGARLPVNETEQIIAHCRLLVQQTPALMMAAVFPGAVSRRTSDKLDIGQQSWGVILLGEVLEPA